MKLLKFMNLFEEFRAPSWDAWRGVLARLTPSVREFYAIVGRGAGKSRIAALIACWCGSSREYRRALGESIFVGVFAPDRKQAAITFRYIRGLFRSVPELEQLVERETRTSMELSNGVIVEVLTANTAAPRGRAYAVVIIEEAAFLPTDQNANPDVELLRAVRPALARVPGSLLVVVTSPYARRGIIWSAFQKHHGQPDGDVVLIQAGTQELNPTFDARAIEKALEEDPAAAAAEYLAQFRNDVESFVAMESVSAVVVSGRYEIARRPGVDYVGFLDFAGGARGGDSATLGIAHGELRADRTVAVLDVLRESRPPFSPEQVCAEFAQTLREYRLTTATADRWAGQFPVEQMRKFGIRVEPSAKAKSDIYKDFLPILNSGSCELLDHPRLIAQLSALERRTSRGGKDAIDHPVGGRDDVVNSAAGALVPVITERQPQKPTGHVIGVLKVRGSRAFYGDDESPCLGDVTFDNR